MTESFRATVVRAFFWLGTGTFAGQFISWISTILVIRLLAPSDYGLMAMAASIIALITMVSELGVGSSLIQAEQVTERDIRTVFGYVLISSLAGGVLCYAAAPLVARFYHEPRVIPLVQVLCINFLIFSIYIVPQALFQREMNFRSKAAADLSAQIGSSLTTLALAWQGAGVWSLVLGQLVLHAIKAVAYPALRGVWLRPLFSLRAATPFVRYGLALTGDRILFYLYTIADTVIVGRFLGNALLGTYAIAMNLASLPAEKVLPIITQVSFTSFSRIQDDLDSIGRNLLRATSLIAYAGFPVFFGMEAVAPEAIPLLLGQKWNAVIVPFQLICLILPLKALSPVLPPAVFAIGKPRVNVVNMAITLAVMSAAFLVGVRGGITGIALAWVSVYPAVFLITSLRCLRTLELPARSFFAELKFPFLASAAMLGLLMAVKLALWRLSPVSVLALLVGLGFAVYAGLVLIFRPDAFGKFKALVQK